MWGVRSSRASRKSCWTMPIGTVTTASRAYVGSSVIGLYVVSHFISQFPVHASSGPTSSCARCTHELRTQGAGGKPCHKAHRVACARAMLEVHRLQSRPVVHLHRDAQGELARDAGHDKIAVVAATHEVVLARER